MSRTIYFAKTKPNAIIPTKRDEDGCYDIYACTDENIIIFPHTVKLIPTGIASAFGNRYRISIRERGSNTKSALIVMAGQIDSGFRGEWFVALYNGNDIPVVLADTTDEVVAETSLQKEPKIIYVPKTKAIAQCAVERVPQVNIEEISHENLLTIESERGIGMLGSSNK